MSCCGLYWWTLYQHVYLCLPAVGTMVTSPGGKHVAYCPTLMLVMAASSCEPVRVIKENLQYHLCEFKYSINKQTYLPPSAAFAFHCLSTPSCKWINCVNFSHVLFVLIPVLVGVLWTLHNVVRPWVMGRDFIVSYKSLLLYVVYTSVSIVWLGYCLCLNSVHLTSAPSVIHLTSAPSVIHLTSAPSVIHLTSAPSVIHLTSGPSVIHLTSAPSVIHLTSGPSVIHLTSAPSVIHPTILY